MSDEQIKPQEEQNDEVEAHHWRPAPEHFGEPEGPRSHDDEDDVEAHHWRTGPADAERPS